MNQVSILGSMLMALQIELDLNLPMEMIILQILLHVICFSQSLLNSFEYQYQDKFDYLEIWDTLYKCYLGRRNRIDRSIFRLSL
jgi:hypothetical protein